VRSRAVVLDVEGTTTPVDFVYGTLFPYARQRLRGFLKETWDTPATREDVAALRAEGTLPESTPEALGDFALRLMDADRKSTGLKSLQGRIWEEGYRRGELRGLVYPDVRPAFERWRAAGLRLAIYSSGSVLAQRLLFAHSTDGDLTPLIETHFDTTTGAKRETESYRRIAAVLGLSPADVLFVSDVAAELDAARSAGLRTALCVRGEDDAAGASHPVVRRFDALDV
jgi:enolase-phosphatase E1